MLVYSYVSFSGLSNVHVITSSGQCRLRIEITDWDGYSAWAEYRLVTLRFTVD